MCNCPIIGDKSYDGAGRAKQLRDEGLFLCSNKVTIEHPFYTQTELNINNDSTNQDAGRVSFTGEDETLLVHVEIDLPQKFNCLMTKTG